MDLMQRRNMLMRGGDSTDWKAMFMGLVDGTISGDVVIPEGVKEIKNRKFLQCYSLTSLTIPDSVKTIEGDAIEYCGALKKIDIGNGLTSISAWSLSSNKELQAVIIRATTPPTLANVNAFANTNNCPIYVPDASVNTYKGANNWSSLASRIFPISDLNNS